MKRCLGCMELYEDEFEVCPFCGFIEGTEAEEKIHMNPGMVLGARYILGKVLGFGGFGVTYIGWDGKLEQKVAIKEYLPSEFSTRMPGQTRVTIFGGDKNEQFLEGQKKFVDEAKRLAKFQNEAGIVKIFDSFIENDTAYIIMEYLDGETLASRIKREGLIPEEEAIQMMLPIMNSLKTVHDEGILHRDIAPDNIFITKNGEMKLIDFGASRYATTSHSRSLTVIIKPGYSPEEQYRSRGDQGPYTDVYAIGACLYKMITGKTPPDAMERRALFESKNKDILVRPKRIVSGISPVCENAILNAMNVRIEDRTPNVQEMIDEITSSVPIKRKNGRIKKIDVYRWPLWFKVSVAIIVLFIVSIGSLMATGVIKVDSLFTDVVEIPEGMVSVPLVEGISITKAVKTVEKNKLQVGISGSVVSEFVEAGNIVYQTPASGLYRNENSTVFLKVSKGNGEIIRPTDGTSTVPYVVGSSEEDAKNDLALAGLSYEIEYAYNDNISEGLVISQSKDYFSQVQENSVINIVISKGSEPFELGNYLFMSVKDAEKELNNLGLEITTVEQETPDYLQGTVVAQDVEPGTLVKKFDTITLAISKSIWSDWVESRPDEANDRVIETKTQYSYSDYESTTQIDNKVLAGWTLDSEKTQTIYLDDYSAFSDWSDVRYEPTANRLVENKNQYRFKQKETTVSESSSLAGWTLYNTTSSWSEYGPWSGWQDGAVSASDSRQVETQQSSRYYYYTCPNCGSHIAGFGSNVRCSDVNGACAYVGIPNNPVDFYSSASTYGQAYCPGFGYSIPVGNTEYGLAYIHNSYSTKTQYRYSDRYLINTYYYERWSDWSAWSDNYISSSDSIQTESRMLYRYAEKTPHYQYSFYRWTTPTEYSDDAVSQSSSRKVTTRNMYRYTTKVD